MIDLFFQNPILFFLVAGALVVSISIHEFAHAFVADKLGDPTARYLGRVTLNPKAHLDPIGTLLLVFAGFGWGRPVPINPINFKNPKRDSALVAFAGPLSNFALATVLAFVYSFAFSYSLLGIFLYFTVLYNLMLGIFNLLPFHPLDGFKVVLGFLPPNLAVQWQQLQPIGLYILIALMVTRSFGTLINPFLTFFMQLLGLS
jgi:Zn-dependent protease